MTTRPATSSGIIMQPSMKKVRMVCPPPLFLHRPLHLPRLLHRNHRYHHHMRPHLLQPGVLTRFAHTCHHHHKIDATAAAATSALNVAMEALNQHQRQAVTAPLVPSLVLAPPGSGKTRVITMRVAYLVLKHGIQPQHICALTFTNRAASEMQERLANLLPPDLARRLQWIGTFHSICMRILQRDGSKVHEWMSPNFTVVSDRVSLLQLLINRSENEHIVKELGGMNSRVLARRTSDKISAWKNEELSAQDVTIGDHFESILVHVYREFEQHMREGNMLDFDDLLMYTTQLLARDESVRKKWEAYFDAILVDEMQDTNYLQLKIVTQLVGKRDNVMVVGDPDQSIYMWRHADRHVMKRMSQYFPDLNIITLVDNYRSTTNIVNCCDIVITAARQRHSKGMQTSNPAGPPVSIAGYADANGEAEGIAEDIEQLVQQSNDTIHFSDIAVLVRTHAQTRLVEMALHKRNIPHRLVRLAGFFERVEVKDLMAYMRLVDNENDDISFARALTTPKRGVGEKRMELLYGIAGEKKCSMMRALEYAISGREARVFSSRPVKEFVKLIHELQQLKQQKENPKTILQRIIARIGYMGYLEQLTEDKDMVQIRKDNVGELLSVCADFEQRAKKQVQDENNPELELPPLTNFLQSHTLFADCPREENSDDDDNDGKKKENNDKVVITTIHAAKGLEWSVVFVPGVEEETIPLVTYYHKKNGGLSLDQHEEERRVLYVGMTRAKALLSLSYASERMVAGTQTDRDYSSFLDPLLHRNHGRGANMHAKKRLTEIDIDWSEIGLVMGHEKKKKLKAE